MKDLDRIKGALYGVAVGDALGAPLEFMSAEEIRAKHGKKPVREMLAGGWLNVEPGEITDDTQMTLAVAMGITENPDDPVPAIGKRFIEWYDSQPKDIGNTCRMAISQAKRNHANTREAWLTAGLRTAEMNGGRSGGNGALMRTVYTGLFYEGDALDRHTKDIAEMTHHDEISTEICTFYANVIQGAISDFDFSAFLHIKRWLEENAMPERPSGWVKDSMNCALKSIEETRNFEEAVVRAVNLGGDADTIGAIAGGLAGALYGFQSIPERWIEKLNLKVRRQLDELAGITHGHQ